MEEADLLKMAGLSTSGVAILLVVYRLVKGKKFISSCCGRKVDVGFDVREMTPVANPVAIANPIHA